VAGDKGGALVEDFAHVLTNCKTLEEVADAFRNEVGAHGYTASAGRAFVPTEAGRDAQVLFRNWPKGWATLSDQNGFGATSFVIAEARKRMTPFTWREIMTARPLSPAEREVLDRARTWGWNNGFVLPVHGPGGYFAIISMASPERDLDLSPERLAYLHMIAVLAHERCRVLSGAAFPDSPADKMSSRELECLRWVANGKTDAEIGEILSISEATVKFHVNGARRKLGARNRAQATARLVLSGLY
jgi:DNA-binding CsgD family transcriptional regulator